MEFRILGPLEVLSGEKALDLGPPKQRSLLALLLLHPNRVVPTDRILEELWGEEAEGKENSLWVYVSRLRGILEPNRDKASHPEVLITRDHGYVLKVDPETIDAVRFERAVAKGRALLREDAEAASEVLHEAIGMWRGSALQDFAYEDFARNEITRLEELRLGATEHAAEADLRRGQSGELIGDLEALHQQHPLRERPVGQLMLALYRAGRSADALRAFERFRRGIGEELGIDPSPELCRLEEQILLHDSRLQLRRPRPVRAAVAREAINPFKGLRPFSEDDAADFYGRDQLIATVVRELADGTRLVSLVGPSGSGKSSTVRAGLIPALRKGAADGSDHWVIGHMLPGSDPFLELEAALVRATLDAPESLVETLQSEDDSGLLRAALRVLPDESSRLLLVIDQFEELFTLVEDEAMRRRFLDQLVAAVDDSYGRVMIVLTLRSDFYSHPLEYSEFATRLASGIVNVVPLTSDELEAAALQPAQTSGVTLEPALLAELIADVIGQPGALPMFQYTLTELFDRRVGDVLSIDVYRAMGGVRGALTRRADELYEGLDAAEREAAQQLFLRLVGIAEYGEWSRRRVHASEIVALDVDVVAMQSAIEQFTAHRLLSLDRDQATGAPTVEVAHEALLQEWARLRGWIEQHKNDLLRHQELASAANRWHAAGRDRDYVYTGGRLDTYVQWAGASTMKLTKRERDYLDAGLERRQAELDAEEERRGRELRLERRARRRTWGMVAAVVLLAGVVGAVLWAVTRSAGPKIALLQLDIDAGGGAQQLVLDGWEQAARELDFQGTQEVPLVDPVERIRELAEDHHDLIITSLFDFGGAVYGVADEYRDTSFVIFDGRDTSRENVTVVSFQREGGAYLMGVAAANESETGHIGFIGGWQSTTTEARRAAYTAGALSVDPDIVVDSVYLGPFLDLQNGPFLDIDLAYTTAADMYRSGVDVIHHSAGIAGEEGISSAAAELIAEMGRDLWVIGTEIDERRKVAPDQQERYLTSMVKRRDLAIVQAIGAYIAGELEPGRLELGLETGAVDYADDGGLSSSTTARLEVVKADLLAGTIKPPSAARQAPRWTRTVDLTATVVFDGGTCTSDVSPTEVTAGDVVRIDVVNESDTVVEVGFFTEELFGVTTLTESGARNGAAMRIRPSTPYVVQCSAGEQSDEVMSFTGVFETSCEGPPVESPDPRDVVRAFATAMTARDADVVCSLFAEDALFFWQPEASIQGNKLIAEAVTPFDDDRWFQEYAISDLDFVDGVVIWTSEYRGLFAVEKIVDNRATIEDGKIVRFDLGTPRE